MILRSPDRVNVYGFQIHWIISAINSLLCWIIHGRPQNMIPYSFNLSLDDWRQRNISEINSWPIRRHMVYSRVEYRFYLDFKRALRSFLSLPSFFLQFLDIELLSKDVAAHIYVLCFEHLCVVLNPCLRWDGWICARYETF